MYIYACVSEYTRLYVDTDYITFYFCQYSAELHGTGSRSLHSS